MDNKKITSASSKTKFNNYKKSFQLIDIFPDDVIKLGECVGQIPVINFEPKNIDEYEEIIVVEAFSPSHFYVHQKNNVTAFYEMMENLHNFYEQYKMHYTIPKIALQPGLHIAVKYFDKWHRAIIKNVNDYSKIEVLFFDYGTPERYQSNELFFLQSQFGQLPGQAIHCGLFNIRPIGTEAWSLQIRQHFFKKIINRLLVAVVGNIIEKNNSLMIDLIDTSQEEDIHLSDWLVEKYNAEYRTSQNHYHNFLYEYDLECNGIRPTNKQPIIPLSSVCYDENNNTNNKINKKINNNDLSCCHSCPRCGYEFNGKKNDKEKSIKLNNINLNKNKTVINGNDKLLSQDNISDSKQGSVSNTAVDDSSELFGSDFIDWARLKDTSVEKDNEKYKISKNKVLTSTDILKDIVKIKKDIKLVDQWCKEYLNSTNSHDFDAVKEYVDVGHNEMTSKVIKLTRTILQDLPKYNDIILNVDQQNDEHNVSTSLDTSKEMLSDDVDDTVNKNNKTIINQNENDKNIVINIADIDTKNNDKFNFIDDIVSMKKKNGQFMTKEFGKKKIILLVVQNLILMIYQVNKIWIINLQKNLLLFF